MALFGLFKSKQEREFDETFRKIQQFIFPNGEADIKRDATRINAITHGKIPPDRIEGFTVACKTFLGVSEDKSDEQHFVESTLRRAEGVITKEEAYEIYVYFCGEATMLDNMSRMMGDGAGADPMFLKGIESTLAIFRQGVYTDDLPSGYGDFGLVATNPVPTISVAGSNAYIARLRYGGRPVQANRIGSSKSEVTPGSVDMYGLSVDGKPVGTIYICPYHKRNSRKAPKGFTLAA